MNLVYFLAFVSTYFAVISDAVKGNNGYIFTSPRSIKTGNNNELQFRRFGDLEAGVIKVQIYYAENYGGNETLALENEYEIGEGKKDTFLNLNLNSLDGNAYSGRLQINGTFGDYVIGGSDKVYFSSPKKSLIFVQTDKPLYKPGQEVKFRVLKLNKKLKPSGKDNDLADVYVEDPRGTRLFQWKRVDLSKGIQQMEFALSDEPTKGYWKISVDTKNETESLQFEVKEYVLPKFDVKIQFPPYVLANAKSIPIEICAKYTYGKPVIGKLNINSSLERYSWSSEKVPILEDSVKLNGCYKYDLNVSLIEPGSTYRYRRIMVSANVVEEGTGVDRNETQYLQRQYTPLLMNFNANSRQYFKPGLPFNGKLEITNPDNTPAADEPVQICATMSRERVIAEWWASRKVKVCKNYTSNEQGIIKYTLSPQNIDTVGVSLEAKSLKYAREPKNSGKQNLLDQPQTSTNLSPFYSPSGSFIQMAVVDRPVPCGAKKNIKLLYTSKEEGDYEFHFQIMRQGKVISSGSVDTSFTANDDVSGDFQNEDEVLSGEEIQIVPHKKRAPSPAVSTESDSSSSSSSSDDTESELSRCCSDCPSAKESKYLPHVGEIEIPIDVDASFSPSVQLLVYYVRDDRETIADSQKIEVEKCFKNQVDFAFGDESKQPGTKTTIQVSASPNSLCGLKVVDKSVTLLDSSNELTKDKVFQVLDSMDTGYYYSSNPCYENIPQPGLYAKSKIRPPGPYSSSSYEDSLASFQNAGFLVISDLTIFTRPCQNRDYEGGYGGGRPSYDSFAAPAAAYAFSDSAGPPIALASVARRPAGALAAESANKVGSIDATKSAVDVRNYFPETWLFEMQTIGEDGQFVKKEKLPHTITEWVGSALCVSSEDGLGISNTTSIKGFQAFFISYTLPASVIRGEEFWIVVSIFSYADAALPISVTLDNPEGFQVTSGSINGDLCVKPDTSESIKLKLKATKVGKVNITVRAETSQNTGICGDSAVSDAVAKDAITQSLDVYAEGYPNEKVENILFRPTDQENQAFTGSYDLSLPNDIVPDSARAVVDVTGNVMGPAMENLDRLVTLPTGCGEQNMVKFTPNYVILDYLVDIGKLSDKIKNKAIKNLNAGYQRQLNYRHDDGSFSAFGRTDKEGSMFLTAFVLKSFHEANRYISIDKSIIVAMQDWIASKQQDDGCFPDVGKIIDSGLQGGIEKEKTQATVTAYVVAALLISKYENDTVIKNALSCVNVEDSKLTLYQKSLYAYANAVAGNKDKSKSYLDDLRAQANETEGVEYYNNVNGSKSINIETAAYAVSTILKLGGSASEALPIVRYMTKNFNPQGGFYSTQDTVVGLEALGQFAKLVYKDPADLLVNLSGGLNEKIEISEDNKLLVQRHFVKQIPNKIGVEATGSGSGLIQVTLRYNTANPSKENKFLFLVYGQCSSDDCKHSKISVTLSYLPQGKKAGMSTAEIKMVSGTVPVKESLEKLKADSSNDIMRYDVENNNVVLYFSEVTNKVIRFSFDVERVVDVENVQPAIAKVYDYYAPENSAVTSYLIEKPDSSTSSQEI